MDPTALSELLESTEPVSQAFFGLGALIVTTLLGIGSNYLAQRQVGGQAKGQQTRAIEAQEREATERRETEEREAVRRQEIIDRYYEEYKQYQADHRASYQGWAGSQGSTGSGAQQGIQSLLGGATPTPPPGHVMPGQAAPAMGGGIGTMAAGPPPPTRPMRPGPAHGGAVTLRAMRSAL